MNGKRVALFGALWIGLCLSCGRVWAQAYQVSGGETRGRTASPKYASQLAAFTSEFDLKSEATFKIGPAIPMGDFKALTGASDIAQGASLGVALDLSYQYYFVPYFGLGVALGAQIFGYDFNTAIQGEYPGKMQKNGLGSLFGRVVAQRTHPDYLQTVSHRSGAGAVRFYPQSQGAGG